jgi:hypothetical protein
MLGSYILDQIKNSHANNIGFKLDTYNNVHIKLLWFECIIRQQV